MPRLPRFFITPEQINDRIITISGEEVKHIVTVLRMKTGDELLLCDGQGKDYTTRIVQADRSLIKTEIISQVCRALGHPRIILGQGMPKADKMDWIVQKTTELGVAEIVPLITDRTIVKIRDEEKRLSRWRKIAREAAMQSDRPDIPRIDPIGTFHDFLGTPDPGPGTLKLFPWEEGTEPIKHVLRQEPQSSRIVFLIGPEGGFSKAEAEAAKSRGFHLVSLGPNILRTETAAIAVLSMIGYEYF